MLTTLTTALLSLLTIDLDNSDLLLRHRRLRTRILGPPDTAIKLRLLNAAQKECRVATLKIPANGAADVDLPAGASLPADDDYQLHVSSETSSSSTRVFHHERLELLMALETELLFSGARATPPVDDCPRALSLVRASLEQKLRDEGTEKSALDSATAGFEKLLGRLRSAAGFEEATPWRDADEMPWAKSLRDATPIIQSELAANLADIGDASWESATYEAIAPSWRVVHLWKGGRWSDEASSLFPQTVEALKQLEEEHGLRLNPMQNVACGIARLPAGSKIAPHCDGNVLGLTCHLGLRVPPKGCAITVGGGERTWDEGELLLFDTSFTHSVRNDAEDDRYVLMLNVLRPGVGESEVAAMQWHLASPPLRLDAINPFYVWVPRGDSSSSVGEGDNDDATPPLLLPSANAGDIFVASRQAFSVDGIRRPAVQVTPECFLPFRGSDEQLDGLTLVVPLSNQQFEAAADAVEYRMLPSFGADSVATPLESGQSVTPQLGVVDEEGFLVWIGFWREGLTDSPLLQRMDNEASGDELDVPMETVRTHLDLLRAPLQESATWLPLQTADGERQLMRELRLRGGAFSAPPPPAPKCGPKVARPITPTKTAAFENAVAKGAALPSVVMCRPFDAGNVGAAARAMLNFGLFDLRLVSPDADPLSDEAILRASGAAPVLRRSVTHDGMADAVSDLQLVLATTARPRESRIPVYSPREAVKAAAEAISRGERVGFLFGSEKNGLSNAELEHASAIVTIPTAPGFSSLNLAQAVLLMCYEWSSSAEAEAAKEQSEEEEDEEEAPRGNDARAEMGQLESLFTFIEESLWESGFFGAGRGVSSQYGEEEGKQQEEARASAAMGKLRRLVLRGEPTKGEASLLRGAWQSLVTPPKRKE